MNKLIYFILFSLFVLIILPIHIIFSILGIIDLLFTEVGIYDWWVETVLEPVDNYLMNKFYYK